MAMPDSSIMLELCDILNISVNDLLCGEVVTMDNYNKEMENKLPSLSFQIITTEKAMRYMIMHSIGATVLHL